MNLVKTNNGFQNYWFNKELEKQLFHWDMLNLYRANNLQQKVIILCGRCHYLVTFIDAAIADSYDHIYMSVVDSSRSFSHDHLISTCPWSTCHTVQPAVGVWTIIVQMYTWGECHVHCIQNNMRTIHVLCFRFADIVTALSRVYALKDYFVVHYIAESSPVNPLNNRSE